MDCQIKLNLKLAGFGKLNALRPRISFTECSPVHLLTFLYRLHCSALLLSNALNSFAVSNIGAVSTTESVFLENDKVANNKIKDTRLISKPEYSTLKNFVRFDPVLGGDKQEFRRA